MKKYETPTLTVLHFSAQDILTFSNDYDMPGVDLDGDEE